MQTNFVPRYLEVLAALSQKRMRRITFLTRNFPFRPFINNKRERSLFLHKVGVNTNLYRGVRYPISMIRCPAEALEIDARLSTITEGADIVP
jgi:hypothetical protein